MGLASLPFRAQPLLRSSHPWRAVRLRAVLTVLPLSKQCLRAQDHAHLPSGELQAIPVLSLKGCLVASTFHPVRGIPFQASQGLRKKPSLSFLFSLKLIL